MRKGERKPPLLTDAPRLSVKLDNLGCVVEKGEAYREVADR